MGTWRGDLERDRAPVPGCTAPRVRVSAQCAAQCARLEIPARVSPRPIRVVAAGGLALVFREWHLSMQLFLSSILLASGFSLSAANTTGPAPVQFLEQSTQAATPRRLTHRRTVDGPPPARGCMCQRGGRALLCCWKCQPGCRPSAGRLCASEFTQGGVTCGGLVIERGTGAARREESRHRKPRVSSRQRAEVFGLHA